MRDDHALDREVAKCVERREQALGVGLVHEDVEPAAGAAEDIAADERRVLRMKNTTCWGWPSSSIASTPAGSSAAEAAAAAA
jgi:hypothetical protein